MYEKLNLYICNTSNTILDALKKIDINNQGFLIVEEKGKVVGTLTDGDIRRAFIKGKLVEDKITDIFIRNFKSLKETDDFSSVMKLFENKKINFLPILNSSYELVNIITKKQMHTILLHNIKADLKYDFFSLDEKTIDYEIYQRPWGFYKTTILNEVYQTKIITIKPKEQLSLQVHMHREEYWIIVSGTGIVEVGDIKKEVKRGSTVFIAKEMKHRLINTNLKEPLVFVEVQIGDYFGEDDIIRYEDFYGRK